MNGITSYTQQCVAYYYYNTELNSGSYIYNVNIIDMELQPQYH